MQLTRYKEHLDQVLALCKPGGSGRPVTASLQKVIVYPIKLKYVESKERLHLPPTGLATQEKDMAMSLVGPEEYAHRVVPTNCSTNEIILVFVQCLP